MQSSPSALVASPHLAVERQVRVVEARAQPVDERLSPPADPPVDSRRP